MYVANKDINFFFSIISCYPNSFLITALLLNIIKAIDFHCRVHILTIFSEKPRNLMSHDIEIEIYILR